uniref:Small ribosomal subunit protein eS1 n=1 Tax=Hemiselmis tepida TaxID=464990 RepID=A0A7S0Z6Y0_9CRYP|mmetsp:Transcript_9071/g.23817  ORF Transcript_9071/g.23817 Transcript_9071/m.23817 type:complete len:223 (+) Transcript_9071:118-786(+)
MTLYKNKRLSKTGKEGRKKTSNVFEKKEWIELKTPTLFGEKIFGKTLVNKRTNTNKSSELLTNRIYQISLGDLNNKESLSYRKIKLKGSEVKNNTCETSFFGMDLTRDKLSSLVKKWQTTIETSIDIKTEDGFFLRIFCLVFSRKKKKQLKKTSYLTSSQTRAIRRKIISILLKFSLENNLKSLIGKFLSEKLNSEIERECKKIFPIYNFFIRKIKVLRENN